MTFRSILNKNRAFLIPYLLFLAYAVFVLLSNTKAEIHLAINSLYSPFFDSFFKVVTFMGDGLFALYVVVFLLFINYRKAFTLLITGAIALTSVMVLKKLVFPDEYRPKRYFQDLEDTLRLVPDLDVHSHFSFPSGHTMAAFCLYFLLAFFVKNNVLKVFFLLLAILVGYSRMYLSQHFLVDVVVGSLLGLGITLLVLKWLTSSARWNNAKWLEGSLLSKFQS